jgi:hypothetical protein
VGLARTLSISSAADPRQESLRLLLVGASDHENKKDSSICSLTRFMCAKYCGKPPL